MIIEYVRYTLEPGRAAEFISAYAEAARSLEQSSHCFGYELSQCSEAPESFILRLTWDSLEGHMKGFRGSPEFATFFQAIKPFVKNIDEMRHYEVTRLAWQRTPA